MAGYNDTLNRAMEAGAKHERLLRPFKRRSANLAYAKAWGPSWLESELGLVADYKVDDREFVAAAVGFPQLVEVQKASSHLLRRYGTALPGMQLSVRDDGNLNALFTYPLTGPEIAPGVPTEVVDWMVTSALRAVGLVGACVVHMNLCDAGLTEASARRWARRAFARYDGLLEDVPEWEDLTARS